MGRGSRFLFVTFFTDNRILDELKAFTAEISGIIEKHYHFTFDVEFGDMFSFADMKEAARVFWIISYRYSPKDVASLEDVLADYRDMGEDNFTAYVSDSLIGKSWKRLHKEKRSLEGFASIEDLKLQLYYDFCTYTEIGGMKIAEGCRKGQIKLAEQPLKTLDPSGVAVFSNPEIKETRETLESQTAKYRELKEQYREKKGETEFFKEYGKAAEDCFETSRKLSRMERQVQDIMDANADFRKWGLQSPMYRVAYALFRQGKFGEAYHALTTKAMYDFDVTGGTGRNWYSECVAATSFLKMKLLQLLPDGYVEPGKKKAPDLMMETASLLENVYWYAKRSPKMYGLVYMRMTFKRRNKRSMFDISFPEDMKEAISKLKKDKGDTRFMEFRFRYALSDYYISDEDYRKINGRSIKSNLDAALKLAQDLSKEYGGLYDMFVGDTYVTYSVYCANKDDIEGMRDMLFASADRYKSAMAANPDDPEPCHRLAESYRTLALSYGREGQLDYCREYFAKSVERYEALKKLDKVTALNCLAELYEDYADIVKPAAAAPGAVSDVSEPEDILLAAIRCRKELAEMSPFEHQTDVGVIYDTLGSLFSEAGMYDEGMDYYRSAAEEYKMCARAFGEKFQPLLAKCYCNMFMAPQAKDVDEAIRCLMWAVTCFDEAQKKDPSFFLPELANAWRCLAHAQLMAGRYEDAISSHIAAIDKYTQADDVCDPE
ncbi:MAG: hypothetical protein LUD50_07645, partial [Clostridia bacterium]|nr:hypothetical protein [Clostridia bacterium]